MPVISNITFESQENSLKIFAKSRNEAIQQITEFFDKTRKSTEVDSFIVIAGFIKTIEVNTYTKDV